MTHTMSAATFLSLVLLASSWAGDEDKKEVLKEDLPRKGKIAWDVKLFEEDKDWTLVKRKVSIEGNKTTVNWVIEVKSDLGAKKLREANTDESTTAPGPFYVFTFYDEDEVKIVNIDLKLAGNFREGERVRATLPLPGEDVLEKTRSIKLRHRKR